jgi:hypothetical protein
MLSRALSLAAVTLLIGCFAAFPEWAQAQNLDAGKSPSQIFAGTCNACHKSPRGLLKTVSPGSLPGFLREHYTTSADMASLLSAFLISNGAADAQRQAKQGGQAKQGADTKPAGGAEQTDRQGRRLRPGSSQEAARPDTDGAAPGEAGRQGRNARRLSRPGEAPDAGKLSTDGQAPAPAAVERGPDGRKLTAKERLRKGGRPAGEELPKVDAAKDELPKTEPLKTDPLADDKAKGEAAREDNGKSPETRPADEGKSEAARVESPKEGSNAEAPVLRPDSVPPAPPATSTETSTATAPSPAPEPASVPSAAPEPAAARPSAPAPSEAPSAVTASAPRPAASPPPAVPATVVGPPAPPISR